MSTSMPRPCAVAAGRRAWDAGLRSAGVIGNCVGSDRRHERLAAALGRGYLGSVRRCAAAVFPERHRGLVAPAELDRLTPRLERAADWGGGIDLQAAIPPEPAPAAAARRAHWPRRLAGTTIAVARDRAFSFS